MGAVVGPNLAMQTKSLLPVDFAGAYVALVGTVLALESPALFASLSGSVEYGLGLVRYQPLGMHPNLSGLVYGGGALLFFQRYLTVRKRSQKLFALAIEERLGDGRQFGGRRLVDRLQPDRPAAAGGWRGYRARWAVGVGQWAAHDGRAAADAGLRGLPGARPANPCWAATTPMPVK